MKKENNFITIIGLIAFGFFLAHLIFTGHWFLSHKEIETKTFIK